jgi:D-3-phosphoglycerate dehydrogenase/(S)-sulfolactate dehydrogenase
LPIATDGAPIPSLGEPATLIGMLEGIDAVLASVEPYTPAVLAATHLRVIARHGVGYDAINVPAATERRIAVAVSPGNHESVAEQMVALLFAVFRGVVWRDRSVRAGAWDRAILPRLSGRTLGLVGMGRIGRAVVPRAVGLGLKVIAHDPAADAKFAAAHGVRLVTFNDLLAEADIVSLHVPVLPTTNQLMNAGTLARMKKGAVLINTSRGGLVDEQALLTALQSGHLFGAGLDVFQREPSPADNPLFRLDNVVVSPHMAGLDHESNAEMARRAAQSVVDLYEGRWPEGCIVNDEIRPGWKWTT